jgi:hypothetical protein
LRIISYSLDLVSLPELLPLAQRLSQKELLPQELKHQQ